MGNCDTCHTRDVPTTRCPHCLLNLCTACRAVHDRYAARKEA